MKMEVKKILASFLAVVIVVFSSFFSTYAITADGILTESDWKKAPAVVLETQKSFNNKIRSAVVKTVEDRKNGYIHLAVMVEFEKCGNMKDGAIKLSINGSEPSLIKLGGEVERNGAYSVEAGSDYDENSGSSVTEISVFFKEGLSHSDSFKINIIDLEGNESGAYTVKVEEKTTTTATTTTTHRTEPKITKPTTVKTTKATTEKTTKTTTRKSTTVKSTTSKTSRKSEQTETKSSAISVEEKEQNSAAEKENDVKKTTTKKEDFTFKKVFKTSIRSENEKSESKIVVKTKKNDYDASPEDESIVVVKESAADSSDSVKANASSDEEKTSDSTNNKKYIYVAIGAVGAVMIASAAVAVAAKSNKKDD